MYLNNWKDKLIFGGDIIKLKRFLFTAGSASSVLIPSCGRETKEKESLWEEMLNQF